MKKLSVNLYSNAKTLGTITPIIATATIAIMNTDFNNFYQNSRT